MTISSHLATYFYISLRVSCHGKAFQPEPKKKNTKRSEIKNSPHKSSNLPKTYQKKLASISVTAVLLNLRRSRILHTLENFLKIYFIEWATSMTMCLTGWSRNPIHRIRYNRRMKRRSKMIRERQTRSELATPTKTLLPIWEHLLMLLLVIIMPLNSNSTMLELLQM